jgi:hypothetical protein
MFYIFWLQLFLSFLYWPHPNWHNVGDLGFCAFSPCNWNWYIYVHHHILMHQKVENRNRNLYFLFLKVVQESIRHVFSDKKVSDSEKEQYLKEIHKASFVGYKEAICSWCWDWMFLDLQLTYEERGYFFCSCVHFLNFESLCEHKLTQMLWLTGSLQARRSSICITWLS